MLCLVVVVCSIIPIIITPIGFENVKEFWDSFHDRTETEIIEWAETEVEILETVLAPILSGNTTNSPLSYATFDKVDDAMNMGRDKIDDIDQLVLKYYETVTQISVYVAWVPFFLLAFLLVFIVCNCRKILPALFTFLYFIFVVAFSILSCSFMLLGVVSVLTCGEVELQNRQLPGVVQWYVVPLCEKQTENIISGYQKTFTDTEKEKATEGCTQLLQLCDDEPLTQLLPAVPMMPDGSIGKLHSSTTQLPNMPVQLSNGTNMSNITQNSNFAEYIESLKSVDDTEYFANLSTMKPFNCSLKPSTIASECTDVEALDDIIGHTKLKDGFPWQLICTTPNCTIGSCSVDCVESIRPYGAFIKDQVQFG
eukprot:Tbor_TRINITY_DN5774_c0_g1::TRINITY_DN5774_c0_g1_i2::g.20063::m.20063